MSSADDALVLPIDGRHRRRVENSEAAVRAMIELFEETGSLPTVAEVAGRAGISPRSVFRYFEDVDALTRAAIDKRFREAAAYGILLSIPDDLDDRIDVLAKTRADMFAFIGPTTQLVRSRLAENPILAETAARSRSLMRRQLGLVFAKELAELGDGADVILDLLDIVFSLDSWTQLLDHQGHSVDEARGILTLGARALLVR